MKPVWKKLVLALGLGATLLSAAAPAEAQYWRRGRTGIVRDRGIGAGGALAAGIAGLAVGAALAGNRDRYYYDNPRRYYYDGPRYYAPRPYYYGPPRGYYNYDYHYAPHCWVERRYDPYSGYPLRVEVCR